MNVSSCEILKTFDDGQKQGCSFQLIDEHGVYFEVLRMIPRKLMFGLMGILHELLIQLMIDDGI